MNIGEAIKQKKFQTEHEKAVINILFTGSWLDTLNIQRLKKHGISPQQFNVLRILRGSHPHKIMLAEISNRMIDKNSNATRLVEKLRQKGYVKRELCESNRRQVDIEITKKGLELLAEIDKEATGWLDQFKSCSKAEMAELNRILDKMRG